MQMPKVNESSENEEGGAEQAAAAATSQPAVTPAKSSLKNNLRERLNGYSRTPILNRRERPRACSICRQISPTVHSKESVCATCKASVHHKTDFGGKPPKSVVKKSLELQHAASFDLPSTSGAGSRKTAANVEIVTSFTDSPLFSRKHRHEAERTDSPRRRSRETGRRKREDVENEIESHPVEVTPVEPRTFVSFQTQVSPLSIYRSSTFCFSLLFIHTQETPNIQKHALLSHTITTTIFPKGADNPGKHNQPTERPRRWAPDSTA